MVSISLLCGKVWGKEAFCSRMIRSQSCGEPVPLDSGLNQCFLRFCFVLFFTPLCETGNLEGSGVGFFFPQLN